MLMTNSRAAMIATGHDPEHVAADEREHRPEHQHLVGERVEERARAGRAVAAGDVAVDAVADAQHEPQPERRPTTRRSSSGITQNISGDSSSRPTVIGVGPRRQRGRVDHQPAIASRRRRARRRRPGRARARRRSRPSTNSPTARSWPTCTTPSISGASRCAAADAGRVDEHLARRADQLVARGGGDRVLQLASARRAARPSAPPVDLRRRGRRRTCRPRGCRRRTRTSRAAAASTKRSSWSWSASVSPG